MFNGSIDLHYGNPLDLARPYLLYFVMKHACCPIDVKWEVSIANAIIYGNCIVHSHRVWWFVTSGPGTRTAYFSSQSAVSNRDLIAVKTTN